MASKSIAEFSPLHLVAGQKCDGVVCPPSARGPVKLLGRKQGLVMLGAVEESELGYDHLEKCKTASLISLYAEFGDAMVFIHTKTYPGSYM